jgi:hypothetical protein
MLSFLVWTVISIVTISVYSYVRWFQYMSSADRVALVYTLVVPAEWEKVQYRKEAISYQTHGGWVTAVHTLFLMAAIGVVLTLICLLLGVISSVISAVSPATEAVVLVGVSANVLVKHLPESIASHPTVVRRRLVNPEGHFYEIVRYLLFSFKGMSTVPVMVIGFLFAVMFVLISVVALIFVGVVVLATITRESQHFLTPPGWWTSVGGMICLAVPGVYALWFWTCETFRVPHYLCYWSQFHSGDGETGSIAPENLPRLVTRPPAHLLPTIPALILGWTVLTMFNRGASLPWPWNLLFSAAWPLVFGSVLWTVRWTRRSDPQPPRTDGRALCVAIIVQFVWLWLLFDGIVFPVNGQFQLRNGTLVSAALLVLLIYYMPDICKYFEYVEYNAYDGTTIGLGVVASGVGLLIGALTIASPKSSLGLLLLASGVVPLAVLTFSLAIQKIADL